MSPSRTWFQLHLFNCYTTSLFECLISYPELNSCSFWIDLIFYCTVGKIILLIAQTKTFVVSISSFPPLLNHIQFSRKSIWLDFEYMPRIWAVLTTSTLLSDQTTLIYLLGYYTSLLTPCSAFIPSPSYLFSIQHPEPSFSSTSQIPSLLTNLHMVSPFIRIKFLQTSLGPKRSGSCDLTGLIS